MQICTFCVGENRSISSDLWKAMSLPLCEHEYMSSKYVSWEKRKMLTQRFQRNFCHFQQLTIWLHHAQIQLFSQYFWKMKICSWSWWVEFFNPHNVHLWISLLLILKLVFCIKQKKRRFSSKPSRFHVECVKQKHFSNEVS